MASSSTLVDLVDQWYEALADGDCVRVRDLLRLDERLLKEGCQSELSREVCQRDEKGRQTWVQWKGRNALHVASWRGCVELVKLVLALCSLADIKCLSTEAVNPQDPAAAESTGDISASEGGQQNSENRAQTAQEISATNLQVRETGLEPGSSTPIQPPVSSPQLEQDHAGQNSSSTFSVRDLRALLLAKDGYFGLEPLPMAALPLNAEIMVLLAYAYRECQMHGDLKLEAGAVLPGAMAAEVDTAKRNNRERLIMATRKVICDFPDKIQLNLTLAEYYRNRDFNFLPVNEYLFHFTCTDPPVSRDALSKALWTEFKTSPDELWRFLLELHDGQGRTPAHVAIESGRAAFSFFLGLFQDHSDHKEVTRCAMTTPDGASRTAVHWVVATGGPDESKLFFDSDKFARKDSMQQPSDEWHKESPRRVQNQETEEEILRLRGETWLDCLRFATALMQHHAGENGFRFGHVSRPFHAAVLTKNYRFAEELIDKLETIKFTHCEEQQFNNNVPEVIKMDAMEFACLVGADVGFVNILKEKNAFKRNVRQSRAASPDVLRRPFPAFHLAASSGNLEMLKVIMDDRRFDPFAEDLEGNTALHHALRMSKFAYRPNFLDYVSCNQFQKCPQRTEQKLWEDSNVEDKMAWDNNRIVERQGCINLLLQAGCDVFKVNKNREAPYPKGSLSSNAKFLLWWYDKQEREFGAVQNNLNFAANAISVTAALVATASYVGPLQPPMGYAGNPNQIQDQNTWVLFFIVCDTISFYLAIAAITFSLIPSLPMPQQSMTSELQRTRRMVTLAVAILFPAIIFVFLAFGAGAFAVVSAGITSSLGGKLLVGTSTVGGFICLVAFLLFFMRLLAFVFPSYRLVRYFYDHTPI